MRKNVFVLLIILILTVRGNVCVSAVNMRFHDNTPCKILIPNDQGKSAEQNAGQLNVRFRAISNIEKKGTWYYIYNEKGKKYKTLSANIGDVKGFSSNFFIVSKGSWYYLYDENGKHYKTMSNSIGEIISVSGDTFVVQKASWIYTYNKKGKKISTRATTNK